MKQSSEGFDEEKYKRLIDGLEITIIPLSMVLKNNKNLFRIEAEYFQKSYLDLEKKFNTSPSILSSNANITCGPFGSNLLDTLYVSKGVVVIRPFNIKDCKVENENLVYISEKDLRKNNLKRFKKWTLLFSRVGDIKIGILDKEIATISPNIIAVEFQHENFSKFLSIFFQTAYGFKQILRELKVSAQPTISTEIIGALKIPGFSFNLINGIAKKLDDSIIVSNTAETKYKEAESLLLNELSLHNWQPNKSNTEIKRFKNSFLQSGRLDAEYYQPKYDVLTAKIQQAEHYKLNELVKIKKSIEPGSAAYLDKGIPFIRVANLSKFRLTEPDIHLSVTHQQDIENLFPKKDTILLTKDGSVGIAYKVDEDLKAITSGAILHLTIKNKKIIPDYLTLVLNSVLTQLQAERDAGGSIIQHWRIGEIENVLIPVIEIDKQQQIAQLIQQSFSLKKQSEQLLQTAKQAVEMAIEEGEEKAIEFIKQNNKMLL